MYLKAPAQASAVITKAELGWEREAFASETADTGGLVKS